LRPAGLLAAAVDINLDEGLGLVAAQTLTFLFTDIDGSATMGQRLGSVYARGLTDHHRLIRAARTAHGR
jgi:hypothetical protein